VAQGQKHAVCCAFLAKHYGGNESTSGGSWLGRPIDTITAQDHHSLVSAFLVRYNGTGDAERVDGPIPTLTSKPRFGLVTVTIDGEKYAVVDIGMRMLSPRELFRAQGFTEDYEIAPIVGGKPRSKTAQIRMCGNSVSPPVAEAIVRANVAEAA
jgi:DNA (cytosine-5)-methyltransferase 1